MSLFKKKDNWHKKKETDLVWWLDKSENIGEHVFSFDKKTKFNLFKDYPYKLTPEQKEIFDKENPYWANFFRDRKLKEQPEECFELEVRKNIVVAPSHPAYFKGRFVLKICNEKGFAEVEENGYTLNTTAINELKLFIDKNFKKLNALSKKKEDPYVGGSPSSICLTYNNVKINVSSYIDKNSYEKIFAEIQNIVKNAIDKGNAITDENSPNPVKEAEEWTKKRNEESFMQDKMYYDNLINNYKKWDDLLKRLKTEKLYETKNSNSLFSGYYIYNQIIWEVFETVGVNNPSYKSYENYLAKKDMAELTPRELVEQFVFWSRGERFCDGAIAEAIDNGNFTKLFEKFVKDRKNQSSAWIKNFEEKLKDRK